MYIRHGFLPMLSGKPVQSSISLSSNSEVLSSFPRRKSQVKRYLLIFLLWVTDIPKPHADIQQLRVGYQVLPEPNTSFPCRLDGFGEASETTSANDNPSSHSAQLSPQVTADPLFHLRPDGFSKAKERKQSPP